MVRVQKKRDWKARECADNSCQSVINEMAAVKLELDVKEEQYDESNVLVLPSKKKQKKQNPTLQGKKEAKKLLGKKERKRLQKILEKKKKKITRAELLDKLHEVQATSEELEHLTSTTTMQTFGLKRSFSVKAKKKQNVCKISNVKGSKKRKFQESQQSDLEDDEKDNKRSLSSDTEDESLDEIKKSEPLVEATSPACSDDSNGEKCQDTPEATTSIAAAVPATVEAKPTSCDVQVEKKQEPAIFIPVNRSPEIQAFREKLPIYVEEQAIMEAIKENAVVIIHGATGTGKTTQVPQFLYEAGYTKNGKMIGITEPRRIAAVSMASRVAEEMNLPDSVSYQIRYERTTAAQTEIKFMTDGVLLKEIRHDFLLSRYSVIVVDEAHERSIFSDVLIGLLSRILILRKKNGDPLKVIIMSATLRVEEFIENRNLFKEKPHLVEVESRQYDVVLHFSKRTPSDYLEAAYKKVCKIHRELPAGGILVFVTGEQEVNTLCKRLQKTFPFLQSNHTNSTQSSENPLKKAKGLLKDEESFSEFPVVNLDNYSIHPVATKNGHQLCNESENEEINAETSSEAFQPLYVLPLYSILPTEEQAKIFKPPPDGARLCVIATNIAETSITIPGLKYVVDTGKAKSRVYDQTSGGISQFVITWTSKASANQRAGRAGRTEGGHCYRLYSSAVFDHDFLPYTLPDIQRTPVDDILLQMKALGIDRVVNFPFPSPPDIEALKAAEKRLVILGALQDLQKGQRFKDIKKWEFSAKVTSFGKAMSRFPVSPRYAKMLLLSYQHEVIPHIIALVSAFTIPELFLSSKPNEDLNGETQEKKQQNGMNKFVPKNSKSLKLGDAMVLLSAVRAYSNSPRKAQFCMKYGVRQKAMVEINKMRLQLTIEMNKSFKDLNVPLPNDSTTEMSPPSNEEIDKIRKILAASLIDHVARKIPEGELGVEKRKLKNAYRCLDTEEFVYIHPSSALFHEAPEFVVYQEIFLTSKYFMKGITDIEPEWMPTLAPNMCEFSLPLETPEPYYEKSTDRIFCNMTSVFGRWSWEMPRVVMEMPSGITKYNWFCYFLLDGQVSPIFKQYKKCLVSPPSTIFKSWAGVVPKIKSLLHAVTSKEVDSKAALYKIWEVNSNFLLREYLEWLPEEKHGVVSCKWPQLS